MAVLRVVALYEFVHVFTLQRVRLECEVYIGAQVVDPEFLRPRRFAGWLFVEYEANQSFLLAQGFEHVAVVVEQFIAILLEKA